MIDTAADNVDGQLGVPLVEMRKLGLVVLDDGVLDERFDRLLFEVDIGLVRRLVEQIGLHPTKTLGRATDVDLQKSWRSSQALFLLRLSLGRCAMLA